MVGPLSVCSRTGWLLLVCVALSSFFPAQAADPIRIDSRRDVLTHEARRGRPLAIDKHDSIRGYEQSQPGDFGHARIHRRGAVCRSSERGGYTRHGVWREARDTGLTESTRVELRETGVWKCVKVTACETRGIPSGDSNSPRPCYSSKRSNRAGHELVAEEGAGSTIRDCIAGGGEGVARLQ